jgi:hypothetical protein
MEKITKDMLNWAVEGIKLSAYRSLSADMDSKLAGDSKKVEVEVDFNGATLRSVFDRAFGAAVISWANGQGRKNVDKLSNKVTVQFVAPAKKVLTDEEIMAQAKARFTAMTPEARAEYLKQLAEMTA